LALITAAFVFYKKRKYDKVNVNRSSNSILERNNSIKIEINNSVSNLKTESQNSINKIESPTSNKNLETSITTDITAAFATLSSSNHNDNSNKGIDIYP